MAKRGNRRHHSRGYNSKREPKKAPAASYASSLDKQEWSTAKKITSTQGTPIKRKLCAQPHVGQVFALDGGINILASGYRDTLGKHFQTERDLGFYLDEDWANRATGVLVTPGVDYPRDDPTPMVLFPWPDYGTPSQSLRAFGAAVAWLMDKLRQGIRIETGCYGGHGRTGTLLACLLVDQGHTARDAIERVHTTYCEWAIESNDQEHFVLEYHAWRNGLPIPKKPGIVSRAANSLSGGWSSWDSVHFDDDDIPGTGSVVAKHSSEAEYEEWLRLNTAGNIAAGQQYDYDDWSDAVVNADVPLPDGWELWDDEEIETYLGALGYNVLTTLVPDDDMPTACEACPNPTVCDLSTGDCLRMAGAEQETP